MPDVLWAVLLTSALPRDEYLSYFRLVVDAAYKSDLKMGILHSDGAKLTERQFDSLFAPLFADAGVLNALTPLLLFENLPDRQHWMRHLTLLDYEQALQSLAQAVARTLDHQSEASTDCRWLKLVFMMAAGMMQMPTELARPIIGFPRIGDMRSVRPSIRAAEIALSSMPDKEQNQWPAAFWKECWDKTDCVPAPQREPESGQAEGVARQLIELYALVGDHFFSVCETTDINPRLDAVFGMVLYGINLAMTLNHGTAHRRVEGRLAIRTLTEIVITLSFLLKRDNPNLWQKFRSHGSGQAKLTFLKMIDFESELPDYIDLDEIEMFANEDIWQEFTSIELGNWAGMDLRKMSEEAGLIDVYDKYYGWPSGYVHGQWGALRDTVFDLCLNPLHRYHRIPSLPKRLMGSVAIDALHLVNMLLDSLNMAYPSFKSRVKKPGPAKSEAPLDSDKEGSVEG
ncbi:hypothetical protein SAMN05880556_10195 [Azospirillum sp. RU38E]|nr:hypothetical protein SAMN05880556_10195 [Azospirillum sp. RU38E]SNS00467.1 hypothetical protein SAMN05880591_10195 [Azospirillum sp. RU37A]